MSSRTSSSGRVLMIAPYFPPRARVGAQRPYRLARELPRHGWSPSVVHLATAGAVEGLDDVPREAIAAPWDRTTTAGGSSLLPRRGRRGLFDRVDDFLPVDGWLLPALWSGPRVLRFARARDPDVVWSTADPWSAHVLAGGIVRRLRRPWVADFRDPWTLCGVRTVRRPRLLRGLDRHVEARVLGRADRIVFTAERTRAVYADAYPRHADRMRVVTNGFEGAPQAFSSRPVHSGRLLLRFFGRFRPLSSAARIVDVLAELRRLDPARLEAIEVRSVGGLDDADRARAEAAGVASAFVAEEAVSGDAARARLADTDLLLLSVEPGRDEILPAKLFDYLAAGRPVFALADSPEIASILRQTGVGVVFGRDAGPLAAGYLARAVRAAHAGRPLPDVGPADPDAVARWSSRATAGRMARVLDEARAVRASRPPT